MTASRHVLMSDNLSNLFVGVNIRTSEYAFQSERVYKMHFNPLHVLFGKLLIQRLDGSSELYKRRQRAHEGGDETILGFYVSWVGEEKAMCAKVTRVEVKDC